MKRSLSVVFALVVLSNALLNLLSCTSIPPEAQLVDEKLRPCPDSPNCVSSEIENVPSQVEPLAFQGSPEIAWEKLKKTIQEMRGKIQKKEDRYLWATFTTRVLRFVDDMEFRLVADESIIHLRSGSRVGRSDLGVNRRRVETLRSKFNKGME